MLAQIVIFAFIAFSKVLASFGGVPLTQDAQLSMAKGVASQGLGAAKAQLADDEFTDSDSRTDTGDETGEDVDSAYGNPDVAYYSVPREEGQMVLSGNQMGYVVPYRKNPNMQATYEVEDSEIAAPLKGGRPVYMRQNAVTEGDDSDDSSDDDDDDDDATDGDPTTSPGYEEAALG